MASVSKKEVKLLCNYQNVGLVGLLETRIKGKKVGSIIKYTFVRWQYNSNHVSIMVELW